MGTRTVPALLVTAATLGLGCSSNGDEMKRQLDQMGRELTALRANNIALQDRVEALEGAPRAASLGDHADTTARPALQVVRLAPEPEYEPEVVIDDGRPRPRVIVHGDDARIEEPSLEE